MDWDTFYFEYWEVNNPGQTPEYSDYQEWLFDKADLALGDG